MLNGVSNVFGKLGSYIYIYIYSSLALLFISSIIISNLLVDSAYADNITTNVTINPSLTLTIPTSTISLDLDPASTTFASQDLLISVGTNNKAGYNLTMSSTTTDLVNTEDNTKTIPTLTSSTTLSDFPVNKWGYKKDSGDYLPFETNTTLLSSDSPANNDTTTLNFASKIDYKQPAGTYNLELTFSLTANPNIDYIQDFTNAMCQEQASSESYTVYDKRDNNDYQVRYINGNCWMVQNLRYVGDSGSTAPSGSSYGTMIMKAATSNISADTTISVTDLTSNSPVAYNTYDYAKYHNSDNTTNGVWYNYTAASAMTITGSSNSTAATYDICPKGWRLPTNSEQSGITSYTSAFALVTGGAYNNGTVDYAGRGFWWSSTAYNTSHRYLLRYNGSSLDASYGNRLNGTYVRCVRST